MSWTDHTSQKTARQLGLWRDRLNASGLPVFSRTVREIHNVSANKTTSAKDLSDVIGHDASMAARVIQIANSPLFNLQNRPIASINAAVVLLGFDAVRDLVISVSVVEEMLKGQRHARLGQNMARAFHAAAQARSFAAASGEKNEEVFVAALLKDVGEMAFWSKADSEARQVEQAMAAGASRAEAEQQVLGFRLEQLSAALAEDWNLGDLVVDVLDGRHADDRRVKHVNFAHEIAVQLEQDSWDSPAVKKLLQRVAKHLDMKEREVEALVSANLEKAGALAKRFGLDKLAPDLPDNPLADSGQGASGDAQLGNPANSTEAPSDQLCGGFRAEVMLALLDHVADGIEQGSTRDVLMQDIVDGLHNALGMKHAYFALFSPDRTRLFIKYAAGECSTSLRNLSCALDSDPLLLQATSERKMTLFTDVSNDGAWHKGGHGAVSGIYLGGRSVGVLYGELAVDEVMSDAQASGFRQLGQQVALVLAQT